MPAHVQAKLDAIDWKDPRWSRENVKTTRIAAVRPEINRAPASPKPVKPKAISPPKPVKPKSAEPVKLKAVKPKPVKPKSAKPKAERSKAGKPKAVKSPSKLSPAKPPSYSDLDVQQWIGRSETQSFAMIADDLNRQGIAPQRASHWTANRLGNLLRCYRGRNNIRPLRSGFDIQKLMERSKTESFDMIAADLNRRGIMPKRASRWTADQLGCLVRFHREKSGLRPARLNLDELAVRGETESYADICADLNAQGLLTPHGLLWSEPNLDLTLRRHARRSRS